MNAIPLTDPKGVVRGWICGTCFHTGGNCERLIGRFDRRMVADARRDAEACCRCRKCKRAITLAEGRSRTCRECAAAERTEMDTQHPPDARPICVPCLGSGETTCVKCLGSGYEPA